MEMEALLEALPSVQKCSDSLEKLRSDLEYESDIRLSVPAPPVMAFFSDCTQENWVTPIVQGNQISNFYADIALPRTLSSEPNSDTCSKKFFAKTYFLEFFTVT